MTTTANGSIDPEADEHHIDLAPPRGIHQLLPQCAFGSAPEPTSLTCSTMVHSRVEAYSPMARM
jgi:hypothetical protein